MKAAFLDRDGVLNLKSSDHYYITSLDQFRIAPGALEGIAALTRAGYVVLVATNQRAVAKGLLDPAELDRMHAHLQAEARRAGGSIEHFYVCPHDKDVCDCRKPKPGLFRQAWQDRPDLDRNGSFFSGDSESDRAAAAAAGIRFVPIETNGNLHEALRAAGIVP